MPHSRRIAPACGPACRSAIMVTCTLTALVVAMASGMRALSFRQFGITPDQLAPERSSSATRTVGKGQGGAPASWGWVFPDSPPNYGLALNWPMPDCETALSALPVLTAHQAAALRFSKSAILAPA